MFYVCLWTCSCNDWKYKPAFRNAKGINNKYLEIYCILFSLGRSTITLEIVLVRSHYLGSWFLSMSYGHHEAFPCLHFDFSTFDILKNAIGDAELTKLPNGLEHSWKWWHGRLTLEISKAIRSQALPVAKISVVAILTISVRIFMM